MPVADPLCSAWAREAEYELRYQLGRIEHCLGQLNDEQLWWRPRPEMNSIANLMLHLAGNVGQWINHGVGAATDTRDRESEFTARETMSKQQLWQHLHQVCQRAIEVMRTATQQQLVATRFVQTREVTGIGATLHSLAHFYGHTQEIVALTRLQLGSDYQMHWTPPEPTASGS